MRTRDAIALLAIIASLACTKKSAETADTTHVVADTSSALSATATAPAAPAAPAATVSSGMMNANTASETDLAGAGVPAAAATALAAGRPYKSIVDVDKVLAKTLSEKQRDSVYARVWIPIDLNSATGDEILLIPGVGPRMRHEFEEYRPYTSMGQFRKEIGKYVDKDEVARLEKYVFIK